MSASPKQRLLAEAEMNVATPMEHGERSSLIRRIIASSWLPLTLLIVGDVLIAGHLVPQRATFALALLATIFTAFAPLPAATTFTVASFPFGPALPLPGFETFALWRIVVATFALRVAWRYRPNAKMRLTLRGAKSALLPHEWIGMLLLALGGISLLRALDPITGLRKLIFLGNAAALYAALRWLLRREPELRDAAIRGLRIALGGLLLVGAAQYLTVQFVSLYDFWQGWTLDIIPIFYGRTLGEVLAVSNTWFSYYEGKPPTLRMFSLLPDSHSFGLTMLIAFAFTIAQFVRRPTKRTSFLLVAFGLGVLLNGSRGIWLSAVPVMVAAGLIMRVARRRGAVAAHASRTAFASFLLLAALFPIASAIAARTHGAGIVEESAKLAFERAESIFNLSETSNKTRLAIWQMALRSIREHPSLGVGFGNAAVALGEGVGAAKRGASAHNLYLDFGVETGILGGLLSIAFMLALLGELLSPLRFRSDGEEHIAFTIPCALAVGWIGLYNLFDVVLLNDRALLAFLTFLAIAIAHDPKSREH